MHCREGIRGVCVCETVLLGIYYSVAHILCLILSFTGHVTFLNGNFLNPIVTSCYLIRLLLCNTHSSNADVPEFFGGFQIP